MFQLLLSACLIFLTNCEKDFSSIQTNVPEPRTKPNISLEIEKVRVREIWIRLRTKDVEGTGEFWIYRDSIKVFSGMIKAQDTTFYQCNLLPGHDYTYKAYLMADSTIIDSSSTMPITTKEYQWQFLGLQDTFALHLKIADPYLYVCAGVYGLWRKDIRNAGNGWEYLGLADTSLGFYINRGVQDVLINSQNTDWILASFQPDLGTNHNTFRSLNGGNSWMPADSGLTISMNGYTVHFHLHRFLEYTDRIVAAGHGVWVSEDFGAYWQYYTIDFGIWVNSFRKHPVASNIIWLGGEGVGFDPWLFRSTNAGQSWTFINLLQIVPVDNAVYSIAFDPLDPDIVYVGMQGAIIKTTDSGETWISPLVTHPSGYFFRAILADPGNAFHLWAVAGTDIIETWDKGDTWQSIENPLPQNTGVFDMIWDEIGEAIYIATLDGVYYLKP